MKATLDEAVAQLGRSIEQFPWSNSRAYADWLAQTYYYVSHSTRLLAAAAARMPFTELGNQLHHRCAAHMHEEKKHELLALHDMKVLGETLESFPELPVTRLLYEPQYMKIEHKDPLALFGYILVLEVMSATHGGNNLRLVEEAHGPRPTAFLKLHSNEDQDHVEKALSSLSSLSPERMRIVEENIRQSAFAYVMLLDTIQSSTNSRRDVAAFSTQVVTSLA